MSLNLNNNYVICPNCKSNRLNSFNDNIVCNNCDEIYPIIYDIPILITKKRCEELNLNYYSKGLEEKILNSENIQENEYGIFKYIKKILIGTNGILYENINEPKKYPLANIPFSKVDESKELLLIDIGCGWGRWTLNAAQKGYISVGIDKSLISLIVAKKISEQLNIGNCNFICCDVLNLPISNNSFDRVYSFSFLQHFSENNLKTILMKISEIMKSNSIFKTQMINKYSLRGFYNYFKIKNSKIDMIKKGRMDSIEGEDSFTVRYFTPNKTLNILKSLFEIDKFENYSFFTQAQIGDFALIRFKSKLFMTAAITMNYITKLLPFLKYFSENYMFTLKKKKL